MSYLETRVLSHSQRVCRLYKKALRTLLDHYDLVYQWRYEAVVMRARFDKHKDEKDMIKATNLLHMGEREWRKYKHPQPFQFAHSPGGIAYNRYPPRPDVMLDYWHPLEKMQYPSYFARRERRKQDYIEFYEKEYGHPPELPSDSH